MIKRSLIKDKLTISPLILKGKMRSCKPYLLWILIFLGISFCVEAKTIPSVLRENFKMVLSAGNIGSVILYVQEGDRIQKGQKLFGVSPEEFEFRLRLAKLQWDQTKIRLKKILNPYTQDELKYAELVFQQAESEFVSGGISEDAFKLAKLEYQLSTKKSRPEDIETAKNDVKLKELQYRIEEVAFKKAVFLAPDNGQVNKLIVHPNEWVGAGTEILEFLNIEPLYLFLNLPLQDIAKLKKGQNLEIIVFSFKKRKTKGIVKHIYDVVDAVSQTVQVRIEIKNEKKLFKPGMRVQVLLP